MDKWLDLVYNQFAIICTWAILRENGRESAKKIPLKKNCIDLYNNNNYDILSLTMSIVSRSDSNHIYRIVCILLLIILIEVSVV